MSQLEYLTVQVPREIYPEVIRLIDRFFLGEGNDDPEGKDTPPPHVAETAVMVQGQGEWTLEMLRVIHDSCPYPEVLRAINFVAANAGRMTYYDEIVEHVGVPPRVFQARMGAFSKFTVKNFGYKTWPFEWGYVGDRIYYRMPVPVADLWSALN